MGCYDGAKVEELVGISFLNKLSNIIDKDNIGLYRDIFIYFSFFNIDTFSSNTLLNKIDSKLQSFIIL